MLWTGRWRSVKAQNRYLMRNKQVAAMRVYAVYALGEEVEVPEELAA